LRGRFCQCASRDEGAMSYGTGDSVVIVRGDSGVQWQLLLGARVMWGLRAGVEAGAGGAIAAAKTDGLAVVVAIVAFAVSSAIAVTAVIAAADLGPQAPSCRKKRRTWLVCRRRAGPGSWCSVLRATRR